MKGTGRLPTKSSFPAGTSQGPTWCGVSATSNIEGLEDGPRIEDGAIYSWKKISSLSVTPSQYTGPGKAVQGLKGRAYVEDKEVRVEGVNSLEPLF